MEISISKKHHSKKSKTPEAAHRSQFLKALFSQISGDKGNSLMSAFCSGSVKAFESKWDSISAALKQKCKDIAEAKKQ